MSLSRFVGILSNSQVLFFMLSISLSISSLVIDRRYWSIWIEVLTSWIYSSVFWNCSMIFSILSRMNEVNSSASCASIFPSGMWLGVFAHGNVVDGVEQLFCVILAHIDLLWDCLLLCRSVACCRHSSPSCILAIGVVFCTFFNFFHDCLLLSFVLWWICWATNVLVGWWILCFWCIQCFEQFHVKLTAHFINGCVLIEFWVCEVLSKGGSSYFCSVSYFLSFNGVLLLLYVNFDWDHTMIWDESV